MKKYPTYKDSGIEWIGEIPEHWNIGKLKYFCEKVTDGSHHSPPSVEIGKRYLSVKDIGQNELLFDDCKQISEDEFELLVRNGCQPKKNDILLTKDGTIGRAAIVGNDSDFVVLSSLGIIRPNNDRYSSVFLREFLVSDLNIDQMLSLIQGSALTRITITIINNLKVIIPPRHEQDLIAKFLQIKTTQLDSLIAKKERLIELLQEERTAIINQAVTKGVNPNVPMKDSGIEWLGEIPEHWEVVLFKRIINKIKDGTHGSFERTKEGKPLLSAKNVYNDGLRISDNESLVSEESFIEITKNGFPSKNDLLITCVGTIGRTFVYEFDEPIAFQRSVTFIRFMHDKASPFFYKLYVQSDLYQNILVSLAKTSAQSGVYMSDILNSLSILPPLNEQKEIAKFLDLKTNEIDITITKTQQEIELLQEYKTALISEVVTGKVDVREEVLN